MAKPRFKVTVTSEPSTWCPDPGSYVAYLGDDALEALADLMYAVSNGNKVTFTARRDKSGS